MCRRLGQNSQSKSMDSAMKLPKGLYDRLIYEDEVDEVTSLTR